MKDLNFDFIYNDMMKRLRSKKRLSLENKYKLISSCEKYATQTEKYKDLEVLNVLKNNLSNNGQ